MIVTGIEPASLIITRKVLLYFVLLATVSVYNIGVESLGVGGYPPEVIWGFSRFFEKSEVIWTPNKNVH